MSNKIDYVRVNDVWFRQAIRTSYKFLKWHHWGYASISPLTIPPGAANGMQPFFYPPNRSLRGCESYRLIGANQDGYAFYEWDICRFESEPDLFILDWDGVKYIQRPFYPDRPIDQQHELEHDGREQDLDIDTLHYCSVVGNLIEGLKTES